MDERYAVGRNGQGKNATEAVVIYSRLEHPATIDGASPGDHGLSSSGGEEVATRRAMQRQGGALQIYSSSSDTEKILSGINQAELLLID